MSATVSRAPASCSMRRERAPDVAEALERDVHAGEVAAEAVAHRGLEGRGRRRGR
jgi:hypothetical protein